MFECPECMYENAVDAANCEQCGAELVHEALSMQLGEVCRACDSYNDPGVRMCVSCGVSLDEVPEAAPLLTAKLPTAELPIAGLQSAGLRSTPPPPAPVAVLPSPPVTPVPFRAVQAPVLPPPGWAAFQQQNPPASTRPAPARSLVCERCTAENPSTARFCGACGHPVASGEAARGKLILIRGLAGEGRQYPLSTVPTLVGRSAQVSFEEDPYVGSPHASFYFRGAELFVKDEGALNGLYVKLRGPHALKAGDRFVVGERLLRYGGLEAVQTREPLRHGSPRGNERFHTVEELLEAGGVGRVCRRPGPLLSIGRAGCDLNFPQDGFVSSRHAEISLAGETVFLRDLGSANGTFLRLAAGQEHPLQHGDYLLMGRELLRVEFSAVR